MYSRCNKAGSASEWGAAFGRNRSQFYANFGEGAGRGYFRRPKYNVPINIIEHATHYQVDVYALSFDKENITIKATEDYLYITGSRTFDENSKPNFRLQEYPVKSFERVVNLRGQVDITAITATQEEGILKVILPKTPQAQKSEQEIKVE